MLADAAEVLRTRPAAVARELTKVHEQFIRGSLEEVAAQLAAGQVRGEVTVCVGGTTASGRRRGRPKAGAGEAGLEARSPDVTDGAMLREYFHRLREDGVPRNDALKRTAREHGLARRSDWRTTAPFSAITPATAFPA